MIIVLLMLLLLPLLHNGSRFLLTCSATQKAPSLDITTDTSALLSFIDHMLSTSHVNNILRNNWSTSAHTASTNVSSITTSVCHWVGVTCGTRHQRVVAMDLGEMGLTGTIPSQLGNLSFLRYLNISNNNFQGQLPEEMGGLRRLRFIDVGFNSFSGSFPSWFGFLPQLKYLNIRNNSFTGPIPSSLSNCSKLEALVAPYNQLNGVIPPEMGNLSNLKVFGMGRNQLSGPILSSLQFCSRLEILVLSYNKLHGPVPSVLGNLTMLNILFLGGNNLKGQIPCELANLVNLKKLGLELNDLSGSIPPSIFQNITSLEGLNLPSNNLSGTVPNEIGNCTSMNFIDISRNHLGGELPKYMGTLRKLEFLSFGLNNFGGQLPVTLFNITILRILSLPENHFMGHLPPTIGLGLPNLESLLLFENQFSGTIPDSISNISRLTLLDLGENNFMGPTSSTFGYLRLLELLNLGGNNLELNGATFITSLNSCTHLRTLAIDSNKLNGPLPSSFGNLTSSLQILVASRCGIMGKIPRDIGNMSNFRVLDLSSNQLVGSLPNTLQGLSNLEQFSASYNSLSGQVSDDICHLSRLGALYLQLNKFSGPLPDCLGNLSTLRDLYLNHNELSAKIPVSLWTLKDILAIDLSSNSFIGSLPVDIGTLRAAVYIDLSMNQFSGTLPTAIGSLQTLANFSLAQNKFEGSIPESFGKLLSLEELVLSYNNLSGEIPKSLEALSHLKILNLSFNKLSGEIPSGGPFRHLTYLSFESNKALCGSPRFHVPQCRSSKHLTRRRKILLFVYVLMGMTLLTLGVLATLYVILKCRKKHQIPSAEDLPPATIHERIPYHELLRATNSFDESNLVGMGSFGSVYKGVFSDGRIWAVKVFKLQMERAIRSFETECEILRNLRHRNLTKVISSCTNLDFMALVLEYMPNGSLDKWLYSHNSFLNVKKRLDIMIDVASAMDYLHNGYSVPVVHCDLKPSNVLLDEEFLAHVTDFGISKFLKEEGCVVQTNTLATIGYTAPEYGREGLVSTKCDVYSFGIMLMEVFTRKRPTEEMFNGDLDLKLWVKKSLPDLVMEVIDINLVRQEENQGSAMLQCVSLILEVASNCSADSPEERMIMKDVLATLKKIKLRFLANMT